MKHSLFQPRSALRRQRRALSHLACVLQASLLLAAAMLPIPLMAQSSGTDLPQMGEPADSRLSPRQEQQLGRDLMLQIRQFLPVLQDVQVDEYITALGRRLATAADSSRGPDFTFFVLRDPTINAFAIPGGYIGINHGLWSVMAREEQLASVIAHEVAHITQRHHARTFATGRSATFNAAAAVLAAIVIGQASPEAGQAALAAGIAATQQSSINFTRANEIEADRVGIEILSSTHYDPDAMAEAFTILQQKNRLNTSGLTIEYLRTHPLDENRIAEAHDRAESKPARSSVDPIAFSMAKARVMVLTSENEALLHQGYLATWQRRADAENSYGLAMLEINGNRPERAEPYLKALEQLAPEHPMTLLLRAEWLDLRGETAQAQKLLERTHLLYPDRYSVVAQLGDTLVDQRQLRDARALLRRYLRESDQADPLAWRQLGNIQQLLGENVDSHESLGHYFAALGDRARSRGQYELALRAAVPESQDALRIEAALKALDGDRPH